MHGYEGQRVSRMWFGRVGVDRCRSAYRPVPAGGRAIRHASATGQCEDRIRRRVARRGLGAWLTLDLVPKRGGSAAIVFRLLNQLDGAKMLLLALTATVAAAAIARHRLPLPRWLGYAAAALATTITLSGIGYLILDNALTRAAWLSLPCLLAFITGTGIFLTRTSPSRAHG